jgi:zinc transporter 1/2/3
MSSPPPPLLPFPSGIGIRETFNENSTEALMVEGILDAVSAGILIYVVLVELMTPFMTQSAWLREQRWWMQCLSFACFWGGVTTLAVIGKWA